MIVGHRKSYEDSKHCGGCGGDMWLVDEDASGRLWWVCNACRRRIEINRSRLKGRYPNRMKPGRPTN